MNERLTQLDPNSIEAIETMQRIADTEHRIEITNGMIGQLMAIIVNNRNAKQSAQRIDGKNQNSMKQNVEKQNSVVLNNQKNPQKVDNSQNERIIDSNAVNQQKVANLQKQSPNRHVSALILFGMSETMVSNTQRLPVL